MASYYSVTPLSGQMPVASNQGETSFTVTNTQDRILETRFSVGLGVDSPAKAEWLQVDTKPCSIPPKGSQQVIVKVKVPPGTTGTYKFCLVASTLPRTEEDFTSGPMVSFTIGKPVGKVTPPPPKIKWWMILIAVVVVLAIVGGILALVMGGGGGIPNVVGETSDNAKQALEKAGLTAKINEEYVAGKKEGIVQSQTPQKGEAVPSDKVVVLDVSSALAVVPCVEGLPVFEATNKLKAAGLQAGDQTYTTDGTAASNTVAVQNPRNEVCTPHPSGLKVAPGSKVNLQIKR